MRVEKILMTKLDALLYLIFGIIKIQLICLHLFRNGDHKTL